KLFGYGTSKSSADSDGPSSLTGVETIERLCDRLQSSLLIEDRHDALKTIKSLSKKYKLEVGTQAMHVLIDVIRQNTTDPELISLSLDTLSNIMNPSEGDTGSLLPADLCTQFTEMFIKDQANLTLLFDLLDEFEFQVRWSSVKLINQLVVNQSEQLEEKVLQIPRGVSRLIDLLNDSREIIRNDAILILNKLTQTNANIQKIIAFESGFDRVMEIIEGEGSVLDGGVIVEDCFNLLLNLLQKNYSNQSFFKEANYIKKICRYFELSGSEDAATNWTQQKTTNLSLLLRLIQCLVAPNNQQQIINDCQRAYNHFGLLHRLCVLLTWPGVPADLLSQAICTVGEVIRGNAANQQLFSSVMMQSTPPRPIITILLLSMINEKQPFHLRSSILYSFECFLYKNEEKKAQVIDTLLPKETSNLSDINTGQILCTGLFAPNDFVSNWLCAVALAHTISNSNSLKEQLLRVQLAINSHDKIQAVSLLQQCMNILSESSNNSINYQFQSKISIIMLISTWLSNCPAAVTAFLSNEQNIPYIEN
ncbi:General vesicular transport factor p115-like protein, partial [Brachionus plicatilis]